MLRRGWGGGLKGGQCLAWGWNSMAWRLAVFVCNIMLLPLQHNPTRVLSMLLCGDAAQGCINSAVILWANRKEASAAFSDFAVMALHAPFVQQHYSPESQHESNSCRANSGIVCCCGAVVGPVWWWVWQRRVWVSLLCMQRL